MALIIGIDPGSRLTGYGIIEKDGSNCVLLMPVQSELKLKKCQSA